MHVLCHTSALQRGIPASARLERGRKTPLSPIRLRTGAYLALFRQSPVCLQIHQAPRLHSLSNHRVPHPNSIPLYSTTVVFQPGGSPAYSANCHLFFWDIVLIKPRIYLPACLRGPACSDYFPIRVLTIFNSFAQTSTVSSSEVFRLHSPFPMRFHSIS